MPPKRRARLSRSTPTANRMASSRAAETPEERQTRLGDQRKRQSAARAAETLEQRQVRLDDD